MGRRAHILAMLAACCVASAQSPDLLKSFVFRPIGPAVTGGRIVDIEADPKRPTTIYVAAATGGLWKTVNNGTTWTPVFDDQKSISIGDIALAPGNSEIVWVGTGEHNNQRSAHYGDGVYKSLDGGKTWANMGLTESLHIGRIAIDPNNPDVVYVAAMGPLYKGGGQRGVFKTVDGGKTWTQVLKGDNDTTGFIEIVADPTDSKVLYAAAMDRLRRPWNIRDFGPGSGVYKTTDSGKTWKKLQGLPTGSVGRIGIAVYPKNPKIVYLTVDNRNPSTGIEIYRSDNAGLTWKKVNEQRADGGSYYGQIRIDPTNPDRIYLLATQGLRSEDGGKRYTRIDRNIHVDHHALWIDPSNPQHMMIGNDGGLYFTYDDAATWDFINNLPIPQFYAVGADNAVPYNVMGGLQDNGVWHGPSRTRGLGIINEHWKSILGGDGFYAVADPEEWSTVYTSSQFGAISRVDVLRAMQRGIRPRDGGLRSNWMSPFLVSPHNPRVLYWCAQKVFMTLDRGDRWTAVSPDLTTNNPDKIKGNVPHCTITTIDESPKKAGVLWVGTDDGNVWVSQDNGNSWTQVNQNIADAPKEYWVSRVEASPHDAATAFVSYTGFREEDFRPFLFKTTDYGKTWTSISGDLPQEQISVVRQDTLNANLLVVGTEAGCYVTLNGGQKWLKLSNGIPASIPCQDLLIQDRDGDLVVGTHGRGIFILNISPLRQWSDDVALKDFQLFKPDRALATNIASSMFDPFNGSRRYVAQNPQFGATIAYYLKAASAEDVKIQILDADGSVIRELNGSKDAGINFVNWNLRRNQGGIVSAGTYGVRLTLRGQTQAALLRVEDWER
jgi:photosystem II stability/assembly factor-like uncharacterized protein